MNVKSWIAVVISLISLSATAAEKRGAKAIFVDTTSGAVVDGSKPQTAPRTSKRNRINRGPEPAATHAAEVAGLMYYLELVSASGQRSRVTADYTFHSGDRVLVHVVSSIDGDVAVFQHDPDGVATQLFPDARVNGGSAFVPKKVDTILPAPTAWFRFDDQTGTERLSIVLTPRQKAAPPRPAATMTTASFDAIRAGGASKGLVLETENSGPEQATYVVRPMQDGRPAEPLIVEIALKHR
jgi:hypothetical protein